MSEPSAFNALRQEEKTIPLRRGRPVLKEKSLSFGGKLSIFYAKYRTAMFAYPMFWGGLASVTVGFWMIYHPLGPIVGGTAAIYLSIAASTDTEIK